MPNAELVANIREWLKETQHGQLHSYRWVRVLIALGEETGDDEPMTVTEAQSYVDKGWERWVSVVTELNRKAACDAGDTSQCSGVPVGQQAEEPVPQTPEVNITAVSGGTEGGDASFTLTATPAPASDLAVSVTVTASGDYGVTTGDRTVTIPAAGSATLTVATLDDSADEPNGSVTLTLNAGDGYTVGTQSSLAADILDDDDPVAPALAVEVPLTVSVDDAEADEGTAMEFTMRLSAPSPGKAHAFWETRETSPASATEGVDYKDVRLSVATFRKGETEKKISVSTLRDAHDDDGETFEVVIHLALAGHGETFDVTVADGVATGTITNDDPLPAAYLARFGRTVAEQALDGIAARLTAPRTPGVQGTLAGTALGATPDAGPTLAARRFGTEAASPGAQDPAPRGNSFRLDPPPESAPTLTAQQALLGAHFSLTGARDATGGSLAAWGRASAHHFDGAARGDGTAITLDAAVTTALLGADYARDDWLLGLALTHSTSEGDYASLGDNPCASPPTLVLCDNAVRAGTGTLDASLTAAVPYAALEATPRLKLWGAAGLGTGEVTVKTQDQRYRADTEWTMAAAGARSTLLDAPPATAGPTLALTADALWTRTASERTAALAASDSDVTRLRLGLEGSWHIAMADAARLVPTLALGARHDGGDAETGAGVELGAGLAWSAPALGLSLDLSGRTLIAHEDDDLEDRGVSAALAFDPDPATERGAAFSVRQDVGGPAEGGLEALFTPAPLADRPGREARAHWTLEAAYGLPALGGRFTASPHAQVGLAPDTRDYTLGWRLTPHAATAPDLTVGLRATRHEPASTPPVHTLGVEASVRW